MHPRFKVKLVRENGSPALAGKNIVGVAPDLAPTSECSVSNGREFRPFSGATELEPDSLTGSASASLVRVPETTLKNHRGTPEQQLEVL